MSPFTRVYRGAFMWFKQKWIGGKNLTSHLRFPGDKSNSIWVLRDRLFTKFTMFQHNWISTSPRVGDKPVNINEVETITFTSINVRVMTRVFQGSGFPKRSWHPFRGDMCYLFEGRVKHWWMTISSWGLPLGHFQLQIGIPRGMFQGNLGTPNFSERKTWS